MAQPTANIFREFLGNKDVGYEFPWTVKASNTVYAGSAVANSSGEAIMADDSSAVVGIADDYTEAGDTVMVRTRCIVKLAISGVTDRTSFGDKVYATEGNTFALSGTTQIGWIIDVPSSGNAWVFVDPPQI